MYGNDPVGWINKFINFDGLKLDKLTWQQEEIATSLVEHKNIAVSAGGGIGKTALMAMLIQWFLITHPLAKIPTTAPTAKQLHDILWSEVSLWLKRNRLRDMYETRKGRLFIKGFPEWYAVARTVSKDTHELNDTLAGFHARHLLIIVDESSGVPDPVFTALTGAMTDKNSYIVLISNPVSTGGFYYDTITDPEGKGKNFKVLFYSAKDSPLVDPTFEEFIITRYGKDSPMYKAKVLGLPIGEYDSVVVPPDVFDEVVNANKGFDTGAYVLSVDVGGSGPDATVFCYRCGRSFYKWETFDKTDPTYVSDLIISRWQTDFQGKPFTCVVDAHGIGAGVYSNLTKANKFPVIGFIGPQKAFHQEMFQDKRAEGFYHLHKNFKDFQFPVPPPQRLKKELANLKFDYSAGPIKMEDKRSFKKRLGFSPDYADAMMMSCAVENFTALSASRKVSKRAVSILSALRQRSRETKYGKFGKFVQ